jgi:hypothetical protein
VSCKVHNRPVLIVYGEIDLFVVELQDALDKAGADSLIAPTLADHLKRFEVDAVAINHVPGVDDQLEKLAGTLTLVLCSPLTPLALLRLPILVKTANANAAIAALARLVRG